MVAQMASCGGVMAIFEAAIRESLSDPFGFLLGRQSDPMVVNTSIMLLTSALCWVKVFLSERGGACACRGGAARC